MTAKQFYSAEDIQAYLVSNLAEILKLSSNEIDATESLESYGLNSAQAMILVGKVEKLLGFQPSPVLLWHYPTIAALSERLAEESEVKDTKVNHKTTTAVLDLNAEAVLDPSIRPPSGTYELIADPRRIFLTGGTGFLGAFIIKELLDKTNADIYCLVRAENPEAGSTKLKQNLQLYSIWEEKYNTRIIPVLGDLSLPLLGLTTEGFQMLAANIDIIYHSAAMLNYVFPYQALKTANVLGTQEILRLATQIKVKPVHYISSVAVFESTAYAGKVVKEDDKFEHWNGIFLGYSQTKWVAEKLVKIAGDRGLPITIHRPPLIAGDSRTGISNTHDFINLMAKGCLQMGCFPNIDYMLDMSPVDYVSQAIVYLSLQKSSKGKAFHLQHPEPAPLTKLVDWLRLFGFPIQLIPYEEWQSKLVTDVTSAENPLYTLRPFLLERWSKEQLTIPDLYAQARRPHVSCQATLDALAGSSIACPPIDSQLFMTYASYLISSGFINVA